MQYQFYLNTEQAAAYLNIKERKLYEMVASGSVPCSKVTGKWLFPRAAIDRWVEAGLVNPDGWAATVAPPIIGGSHDQLLEWAVRRSGSGLALLAEGSVAGLERLSQNQVAMAAIHLHGEEDGGMNVKAVSAASGLQDAVLVAFARREQGLVVAQNNPLKIKGLADAIGKKARFGQRQKGAGAQLLLCVMLSKHGLPDAQLIANPMIYQTGQDLASGIRAGEIDCGVATQSAATMHGLDFVPLIWEQLDLVMRRRVFCEPAMQALLSLMRTPEFARQAQILSGYDIAEAGLIRLNR